MRQAFIVLWASFFALLCPQVLVAFTGEPSVDGKEELAVFEGQSIVRIGVQGNRFTRDYVIWREVRSRVGQPFSVKQMQDDVRRLDNLDIFSSVDVLPSRAEGGVVLSIQVREIPPAVPYISYDVTDEDGWSYGPALKAVNMLGRDVYVTGSALFGGKTTFLLEVNDPWIAANHLSLDLVLARIERFNELDGFGETTLEFSPWLGVYAGEHGRLRAGFSYFAVSSDTAGHTLSTDGKDHLWRFGLGGGYDSRDWWGDPHRGWHNDIEWIKTGGLLPGDGDFWRLDLDLRRYQPLTAQHTLALGTLVTLQSGKVGRDLPEYMDFHLGGSNTIRGYNVEELGRRLFGKNELLATAEYRFPLAARHEYEVFGMPADLGLAGALFVDTGLAWNRGSDFELGRAKTGYGLGLRLLMPAVDMTRLDVGFDEGGNWRVHFASFAKFDAQRLRLR